MMASHMNWVYIFPSDFVSEAFSTVPVWQVNVASVVKDNAQFVHALTRVPDPKMQIWHYRLLTGADSEKWCGWKEGMSEGRDQQRKKF